MSAEDDTPADDASADDAPADDAPSATDGAAGESSDGAESSDGEGSADPGVDGRGADRAPVPVDFADPRRRPGVDALVASATARFATALGRELGAAFRFALSAEPGESARRSQGEILEDLAPGTPCVPLALVEPAGEAWLIIDRTLAFALADRRYGGTGATVDDGRSLSTSERRIVATLRAAVCRSLEKAWAPVTPLGVRDVGGADAQAAASDAERFARGRPDGPWHACPVAIDVGGGQALCTVLVPHSAIAPLVAPEPAPVVHRLPHASSFGEALAAGVRGCDVELVGVLAERGVTLGELGAMRPGTFLALDERRPVRFRTDGRAVFDARLGLDAGRLCASVTRLHLSTPGD